MTNPHIETLVNFLRDFADANADSFAPEQIEHLNRASVEIAVLDKAVDNLIKERDDARREWCKQEAYFWDEPAIRSAQHIAESRGWNCFKEDSDAETNP
jgi:hypothetical protein